VKGIIVFWVFTISLAGVGFAQCSGTPTVGVEFPVGDVATSFGDHPIQPGEISSSFGEHPIQPGEISSSFGVAG